MSERINFLGNLLPTFSLLELGLVRGNTQPHASSVRTNALSQARASLPHVNIRLRWLQCARCSVIPRSVPRAPPQRNLQARLGPQIPLFQIDLPFLLDNLHINPAHDDKKDDDSARHRCRCRRARINFSSPRCLQERRQERHPRHHWSSIRRPLLLLLLQPRARGRGRGTLQTPAPAPPPPRQRWCCCPGAW